MLLIKVPVNNNYTIKYKQKERLVARPREADTRIIEKNI